VIDLCAAQLVEEVGNKWIGIDLPSDLVEVSEVHTESQVHPFLSKEEWVHHLVIVIDDEPLAEHVVEEFAQETQLCSRKWVDVAMRRFWSFSR